jgi:hypothetical protein
MQVFLLAIILVALAIGGIAIKMFLVPGGTFKKTCGSAVNPDTGQPLECACAAGKPEDCKNPEERTTDLVVDLKIRKLKD